METQKSTLQISLTNPNIVKFFLNLSLVTVIGLLSTSAFSQVQDNQISQDTSFSELVNQKNKLSEKLADRLLNAGGSTAEISYADEIDALREQIANLEKEIKILQSKDNYSKTNFGWFNGFLQNQITLNSRNDIDSGFFRTRRARFIYNHIGDSKTFIRVSFEFASGTNQLNTQVRDSYIQYRPNTYLAKSGPTFTVGAQNIPLGYEIAVPSWARTWPERSAYNQTYFSGERGKGLIYQNGTTSNYWYAGFFNSLTVNDTENLNNSRGPAGGIGPSMGIAKKLGAWTVGISYFDSQRPAFDFGSTHTSETDRKFTYFDFRNQQGKLDIRGEWMVGKDRLPGATVSNADETTGGHINFDYKTTPHETFVLRYEFFDRNKSSLGDYQQLWGIGYVKDLSQYLRLCLCHELDLNTNGTGFGTSFQLTTLRLQFRF